MRRFAILALAIAGAIAGVSAAEGANAAMLFSQYDAARQVFLGNATDQTSYSQGYAKVLFPGIDGNWAPLSRIGRVGDESSAEAACAAQPPTKISTLDAYTLLFSTPLAGEASPFEIRYSLRYGSLFGSFTDVAAMQRQLGLDAPGNAGELMTQLARSNGTASIWRFSPDILVIQEENGMPIIWGRCPG